MGQNTRLNLSRRDCWTVGRLLGVLLLLRLVTSPRTSQRTERHVGTMRHERSRTGSAPFTLRRLSQCPVTERPEEESHSYPSVQFTLTQVKSGKCFPSKLFPVFGAAQISGWQERSQEPVRSPRNAETGVILSRFLQQSSESCV